VDTSAVAKKTKDFSGADLKALVDTAVEEKLEQALASGTPVPITTKDLLRAMKRVKPSTRDWFASARNYALYANEGGLYDEIREYLKL
jgi:SpoVK/Ycf46/Vps4 family AAA+-type ATPase